MPYNSIKSAISSGHGDAIVYATLIGLVASDIIPTPADTLYFHLSQKNKEKLEKKEINPKQYWTRDAVYYYSLNPIWWLLVGGVVIAVKGDYSTKMKVGLGIIAAGGVYAVLNKNIKKDEELQQHITYQ
jgi:dipeptide/tripeptide permease